MTGGLADTYVAALQHDTADVPGDATLVGVVRRPTGWFSAAVDENAPALAPPEPLLEDAKARERELEADGVGGAEANRRAWRGVDFAQRYREHLEGDADARDALGALAARLAGGESLALVCFENTDEKRCHRTILRDRLAARLEE
ncbi:DUF488 family protein [Halobacterium yunchengense]|uniref:DUF488 family protein, N3 subclade n=1 Tax=Halobacterium yunchengense TaxID=3108497 RepID=UPI00300B0795